MKTSFDYSRGEPGAATHAQTIYDAIRANLGIEPPDRFDLGKPNRFSTNGKRSDKSGWCYLFPDGQGAVYGDWRTQTEFVWQAHREKPQTEAERAEFQRQLKEAKAKSAAERERTHQEAAKKARDLWATLPADDQGDVYTARKQVQTHGTRRARDGRRVVPGFGPDGAIQTLQFIAMDGSKLFLKEGKAGGAYYWLGTPSHASTLIYIAEGFATAASVHEATGHPAYIAFNAGNLETIARMVRGKFPSARIVIAGDDDIHLERDGKPNTGRIHATAAAEAVGGIAIFPEGGGDWNDTHMAKGLDAVAAALSEMSKPDKPNPDDLLADYIEAAAMDGVVFTRTWIAEKMVEQGRVYEWFGKWKNGKTIAVIDLCAHASAGRAWGDRRTVQTLVVWVAGESCEDVQRRIAAWRIRHRVSGAMPFFIRTKPVHIDLVDFAARLASEIEALKLRYPDLPVLLVVDTVARSLSPGCDENSNAGMGAFANNIIDHVVRPTGSAAICVHHSGHGDSERGRGWSGWPAAVDGSVKVEMQKGIGPSTVTVSTIQARSTAGDDALQFRVDTQEIPGQDNFGNQLSEPVLFYLGAPAAQPKAPTGHAQKTLLAILKGMTKGKAGFRVSYKDFRGRCLAKDEDEKAMSASTFSDAFKKLRDDGHVIQDGPEVWIPDPGGSDGITKFRNPKGFSEFSESEAAENPERNLRKDTFSEFSESEAAETDSWGEV